MKYKIPKVIHLTFNPATFNKYSIIMQFIVHGSYTLSEKNVVQKILFGTNFMDMLKISSITEQIQSRIIQIR